VPLVLHGAAKASPAFAILTLPRLKKCATDKNDIDYVDIDILVKNICNYATFNIEY
jgi:hypothetical protein